MEIEVRIVQHYEGRVFKVGDIGVIVGVMCGDTGKGSIHPNPYAVVNVGKRFDIVPLHCFKKI